AYLTDPHPSATVYPRPGLSRPQAVPPQQRPPRHYHHATQRDPRHEECSALLLTAYCPQCLTRSSAIGRTFCPMLAQARPHSAITPFHVRAEFLNVCGTGSTRVATILLQFGRRSGQCARSRRC